MKNIYKILVFLLLLVLAASPGTTKGQSYTLYPPSNLQGQSIDNAVYLSWPKPVDQLGLTPAGLVGYYVYRSSNLIHYISDPDSLCFYDLNLISGTYSYTVTANYDLTSYGFPGIFQQSVAAGPAIIDIIFDTPFPFQEGWNSGTFTFNVWTVQPSPGNWSVSVNTGNPAPVAQFSGIPALTSYDNSLTTTLLSVHPQVCYEIFLEFDYKLIDINGGNTEKLSVECMKNGIWNELTFVTNQGTTDWIHQKFDISSFISGNDFKVKFRVSGSNSSNIDKWLIDNIYIYGFCLDPIDPVSSLSGNVVTLNWQAPCDSSILGYNIYRTDNSGLPPFVLINPSPIPTVSCIDILPPQETGIFRYIVKTIYAAPNYPIPSCISEGKDTLTVDLASGVGSLQNSGISISPNPAGNYMNITCHSGIESVELFNLTGSMVLHFNAAGKTDVRISTVSVPEGVYLVRITTAEGTVARKISVKH